MSIEFLETDFDKVSYLANVLTARATGMASDSGEYEALRRELLNNPAIASKLPHWIRQHRSLDSFWGFIQPKFSSYAERRTYISEQFTLLLDELEFGNTLQLDQTAPITKKFYLNQLKLLEIKGRFLLFMVEIMKLSKRLAGLSSS